MWDVVLGRIVPALVFAAAALVKALEATAAQEVASRSVPDALRFAHEVLSLFLYATMTVAYVTRLPRRSGRRDVIVVVVALMVTMAMAIALLAPPSTSVVGNLIGIVLLVVGTLYCLVSLAHLRRSFSILPEARELVTTGPYAVSRHPLYLAETIAMAGVVAPAAFSVPDKSSLFALAIIPFVLGQWVRMRWEETVLAAEFPTEYADYACHVPRVPFASIWR